MAAISSDDLDKAIVTFCYEALDRQGPYGRTRGERMLQFAFVQFPDSGDQRYVAPLSGARTVGIGVPGSVPYYQAHEYMRSGPFPHEADQGNRQSADLESSRPGPIGIHYFGFV